MFVINKQRRKGKKGMGWGSSLCVKDIFSRIKYERRLIVTFFPMFFFVETRDLNYIEARPDQMMPHDYVVIIVMS